MTESHVALAVRELGEKEVKELAPDAPVSAGRGGARRGLFSGSAALALGPLLALSQPTQC